MPNMEPLGRAGGMEVHSVWGRTRVEYYVLLVVPTTPPESGVTPVDNGRGSVSLVQYCW